MTQEERLDFLISYLKDEKTEYGNIHVPEDTQEKRLLLRSLMNVRMPEPVSGEFIKIQNEYLKNRILEKGITKIADLTPVQPSIYLWQGDITTLEADAIVNAANSKMLGCFCPCHGCIDNAIHTFSGVQLRAKCAEIMKKQGHDEKTGDAKITPAYNLPCRYVLHTVGPVVYGAVTKTDREQLSDCYLNCLELAADNDLRSVAFCCISTGEFHFPNELAAEIAIRTVMDWQRKNPDRIEVIFNVFKDSDYEIYKNMLG